MEKYVGIRMKKEELEIIDKAAKKDNRSRSLFLRHFGLQQAKKMLSNNNEEKNAKN